MSKRQILMLVLSLTATLVAVLLLAVVLLLLEKPQVNIVWTQGTEAPKAAKKVKKGKWEGKEKLAIKLIRTLQVPDPAAAEVKGRKKRRKKKDEPPPMVSVDKLITDKFFESRFKLKDLEAVGWEARFLKKSYYFVSYKHREGLINQGPTWLVDVARKKVLPKNIMARAAMNPAEVKVAEYFERERQVIGAIASHSFEGGVKLGGIMLIHFAKLPAHGEDDEISGWTVVHDYGDNYRAYFQWVQGGEPTYADFEFDYAKKALRARNLQAANFMNMGEDFDLESEERARIMPETYDPNAKRAKDRWTGDARRQCSNKDFRKQCQAMATVLKDQSQIEAVEWLLTVLSEEPGAFKACKEKRRCKWSASTDDDNVYRIEYIYDLKQARADEVGRVSWEVNLKKGAITPRNKISEMAFLAVHPRLAAAAAPKP